MKRSVLLKRSAMSRSSKPMKKNGRKSLDWIAVRRRLSAEFSARGVTSCELRYSGCWGEGALGFAHGRKRRHLRGDELATLVILSCNPCHDRIERLSESEMYTIVESVIEQRGWKLAA